MLGTPRGRINGAAFALSWVLSILIVSAVLTGLSGDAASERLPSSGPVAWNLIFGALLILIGVRKWLTRPKGDREEAVPKWMADVDRFGAGRAAGLALALSILNPKNLALIFATARTIAGADLARGDQLLQLVGFTLVASVGILLPVALHFLLGARAEHLLDSLKSTLIKNNSLTIAVVCIAIGIYLILP